MVRFNSDPFFLSALSYFTSELQEKHTFFYVPFAPLAEVSAINTTPQLVVIETFLQEQKWEFSLQACSDLIHESLQGLHYLQTYDRFLIKAFVATAYLGWAAYASLYILRPFDNLSDSFIQATATARIIKIASWTILIGFWVSFALQKRPWTFYVYIAFPCYFWQQFSLQASALARSRLRAGAAAQFGSIFIRCLVVVFALLCMVVRFCVVYALSLGSNNFCP